MISRNERSPDTRIGVEVDLAIVADGNDGEALFYGPSSVDVDKDGNMYILDVGNSHVQVFTASGVFLRTLGAPGQGPGELQRPAGIAVSGDRVFVSDMVQQKLVIWEKGTHVRDVSLSPRRLGTAMYGASNDGFVGDLFERMEDGREVQHSVLFSAAGDEVRTYVTLPVPPTVTVSSLTTPARARFRSIQNPPAHVVAGGEEIYVSTLEEYQVLAVDVAGTVRWALRTASNREAFSEAHRAAVLAEWGKGIPDPDPSGIPWPSRLPALSGLLVDGHSHLYVFPHVFPFQDAAKERPVDVFSAEGDHLFSGYMPTIDWTAALGDFVYAIRENPNTGNMEPVRYRLLERF